MDHIQHENRDFGGEKGHFRGELLGNAANAEQENKMQE